MVKINYNDIRFDHIVVFSQEDTIFACCKENGGGKTRLFLTFGNGDGSVYTRNGRADSWEILQEREAGAIRQQIKHATKNGVPVYRLNGSSEEITGKAIPA